MNIIEIQTPSVFHMGECTTFMHNDSIYILLEKDIPNLTSTVYEFGLGITKFTARDKITPIIINYFGTKEKDIIVDPPKGTFVQSKNNLRYLVTEKGFLHLETNKYVQVGEIIEIEIEKLIWSKQT